MQWNQSWTTRLSRAVVVAVSAVLVLSPATRAERYTVDGWTDLTKSPDTRTVYVSSSQGNDNNSGLTPDKPVKSITKGYSLLRNGFPDWLLLKRGDVFNEPLSKSWKKSGRSVDEPMVVNTYGVGPRPQIRSGSSHGLQSGADPVNHLAIVGLHLTPYNRGASNPHGIRWLTKTINITVEDCYISGYATNITFDSKEPDQFINVRIRRNVIVDSYATSGHSQGMFASRVKHLLIEENVFDHNGWNENIKGAEPTTYNHNMYLTTKNTNVTARRNISARAAATGMQARSGGVVVENLFVGNACGLNYGWSAGGQPQDPAGVSGWACRNVIMECPERGFGGYGMAIGSLAATGVYIADNVIAIGYGATPLGVKLDGLNNGGIKSLIFQRNSISGWFVPVKVYGTPGTNIKATLVTGNVVHQSKAGGALVDFRDAPAGHPAMAFSYNTYHTPNVAQKWFKDKAESMALSKWKSKVPEGTASSNGSPFVDATRTVGKYNGKLGGAPTMEAFLAQARKQSRSFWRPEYTADPVVSYLRAGWAAK